MNRLVASHRSLFNVLFATFEAGLWGALVTSLMIGRRRSFEVRSAEVDAAAAVTFLFSLAGLAVVSWLLRRTAPRLATAGVLSFFAVILVTMLFPAL